MLALLRSILFFFFFLMIRRPPRSTLFPTRRSSDLPAGARCDLLDHGEVRFLLELALDDQVAPPSLEAKGSLDRVLPRSEEHTSELQSRGHLVCRLLLEKKKKNTKIKNKK